jgi:hypothetical protein
LYRNEKNLDTKKPDSNQNNIISNQ